MSRISKLECEAKRLTKIHDNMDLIFGVVCVMLIITAAVICPVMVNL